MLSRLFAFLFGDVPVEFRSAFSLQESVQRLRNVTKRNVFLGLFNEVSVGRVTETSVRLQRVRPAFANPYKPIFVGKFEEMNGRVSLRGRFTMPLFSKIFMSAWLTLALVFSIVTTARKFGVGIVRMDRDLVGAFFPITLLMFGVVLLRFSWWLSRTDIGYLTKVIKLALCSQSIGRPEPLQEL
jgi:hypothetical protein